jgi:chorismate mutase
MANLETVPLNEWALNKERPFVIAGPCSAETEEQVMDIAAQLDKTKVHLYRAGIWKPRTRPNSFEGVGSVGLKWLQLVKQEYGLKTSTEVANVKHVYEALKAGIDVLWIGARTTTNPFAVQEIADALQGVDIPVLVKNPVNPDLELWIGAIERMHQAGIRRLGAIHRGFSSYGKSKYRNDPHWQIAIDFKRRMPGVPLINDPSHITGNASLIEMVAQKAMDLNFDGLMIETHNNPPKAWSDAKQQITPFELHEIINRLVIRHESLDATILPDTLEELRTKIDQFDNDLIETLVHRMDVVSKIGEWKKENNVSIYQSGRFEDILKSVHQKANEMGMSEDFAEIIFKAIHEESISIQTAILNSQFVKANK